MDNKFPFFSFCVLESIKSIKPAIESVPAINLSTGKDNGRSATLEKTMTTGTKKKHSINKLDDLPIAIFVCITPASCERDGD